MSRRDEILDVATTVLGQVSHSGMVLIQVISTVLLVPVLSFYFLRDWDVLVERIDILLPRTIEPTIARLARQSDEMLGGFVRVVAFVDARAAVGAGRPRRVGAGLVIGGPARC